MASQTLENPSKPKEIFGHPAGLFVLFFTEMWERFSFYGMKALFIFYLTKYHLFADDSANLLLGSYAALVYALPVLGGYIADKFLGFRKAVTFGGIMLVLGHIGMAYEGEAAKYVGDSIQRDDFALQVFYFSLSLIILGVGFLKANISSIVGELYKKGDSRRDSGFTIFYMGINLGSFFATILCVYLGENFGWGYGFGAAGVGMIAGLITFIVGKKHLLGKGEPNNPEDLKKKSLIGVNKEVFIYIIAILSLVLIWQMVQRHTVVEIALIVSFFGSVLFILWYAIFKSDKIQRDRLFALTILIFFSVVFWALFEQAYSSLNLFADRVVDRNVFGTEIAAGNILSLNALFIFAFAPVFAWMWVKLSKVNLNPNAAVKFGIGIILVGVGFGALVWGGNMSGDNKVAIIWMVVAYMLHTFGELCLSPVGLSYVTKLAPHKIVGFMMGFWFLATASSEYIASLLANLASLGNTGENVDLSVAKTGYIDLFEFLFYVGISVGVVLLIISPLLKKMMHGVDNEKGEE